MAGRLGEALASRPRTALVAGAVLVALVSALAVQGPERLAVGPIQLDDGPAPAELVVVVRPGPRAARGSRVHAVALDVIQAQVRSGPAVARVRVRQEGEAVELVVGLQGDSRERRAAAERIVGSIDPGPLRVGAAGQILELERAGERLADDLWRLELLALPLLALAAAGILGLRLGAAATAAALLGIGGCAAVLGLAGGTLDASLLGIAAGAPVGVAAALELAGLLSARHREAEALGAGAEAPALALSEWLAPVALAVAAAAAGPLALLVTPLEQAPSVAVGSALAALFAGVGVALFAPAALAVTQSPARGGVRTPAPGRGGRSRLARAWLAVGTVLGLAGATLLATVLLERPPAGDPLGLAPTDVTGAAALAAALAAILALILLRAALTAAVAVQERREFGRALPLLARGHALSTLGLVLTGGILVVSDLLPGDVPGEPELRTFGAVLAAGAVLDFIVARAPVAWAVQRRPWRSG